MASSNIISFHSEDGASDLDKGCNFVNEHFGRGKCWRDPWDKKHAVAAISTSTDNLERLFSEQNLKFSVAKEEETSSIIVIIENPTCFGLKDKLKLLFQWKINGGSEVKSVECFERPNFFEVVFAGGWDAILNVCKHKWDTPEVNMHLKVVKVVPCFKTFRKQRLSENHSSPVFQCSSYSDGSTEAETNGSPYHPGVKGGQRPNNNLASRNEVNHPQKRHDPDPLPREPCKHEVEKWNSRIQQIESEPLFRKIPFPRVWDYLNLTDEGKRIMENVQKEFSCEIGMGQEKKTDETNFKVTLLVTAAIGNMSIHLVQGSARDINVAASLHIDDVESGNKSAHRESFRRTIYVSAENWDRPLVEELESLSNRRISTLAISLSSKLGEKLSCNNFAKTLLQELEEIFRAEPTVHIFLCENESRALFQAYKYYLMKLAKVQAFGKIDEKMWTNISPKDFSADHRLKKVQVVQSIRDISTHTCFVYLPISQNLEPSSCPTNDLGLVGLENPIKCLHSNMTEEELDAFCVSSTHALRFPVSGQKRVHVYCTSNWTFNVAKSIQYSLHACLRACSDYKDSEVYIYPPGIYPGDTQYPVMFTVQKCLHALMKCGTMLQKISSLYLVVPEIKYYEAFKEVFDAKSSSFSFLKNFSKKFEHKPESCLEIRGRKRQAAPAFDKLEKILQEKMDRYSRETDLNDHSFDSFKNFLQASPPAHVTVNANEKKVKVSGLTRSVVQDFLETHKQFFKRSQSGHQYHNKTEKKKLTGISSNPREYDIFQWWHINDRKEMKEFKQKKCIEIEKAFQDQVPEIQIAQSEWTVYFKDMKCVKSQKNTHKGGQVTEYLLRTERIEAKDSNLESGKNREWKPCPYIESLLPPTCFTIDKIFKIDSPRLKARFDYKRKFSTKFHALFWHPVEEQWASSIAKNGFQKLFSSQCQKNVATFSKHPRDFMEKGEVRCLLLCDILSDDPLTSTEKDDLKFYIFAKLSDAHILPKFVVKMKMI